MKTMKRILCGVLSAALLAALAACGNYRRRRRRKHRGPRQYRRPQHQRDLRARHGFARHLHHSPPETVDPARGTGAKTT
ncbi:MAG: hypothetical protein ACLU9S_05000 [Oscillospiraceae bacterium]